MRAVLHSDEIIIGLMLSWMLVALVAGGLNFWLACYISRKHPKVWQQLGRPALVFAMGARPDPLATWLRDGKFKSTDDKVLLRWCPVVRDAERLSTRYFVAVFAVVVSILLLRQL